MPMAKAAPWRPPSGPPPPPPLLLLLLLLASGGARGRAPLEAGAPPSPSPSPSPQASEVAPEAASEPPGGAGERCLGYYDVMGQWDPPFRCSTGPFRYCCGTCGYRFCCRSAPRRLAQSRCSNYDTPGWLQTGPPRSAAKPAPDGAPAGPGPPNPARDRAHVAVYSVCGAVALLALGAILTRLGLDKARSPRAERAGARALSDLLKQPGGSGPLPPALGNSVQVPMGDGLPRGSPRNGPESSPGRFYRRFPSVDVPVPSTVSLPPRVPGHHKDLPLLLDGCPWATPGPRAKGLRGGPPGPPACQAWAASRAPPRAPQGSRAPPSPAPRRPPAHVPKRQFSGEQLGEASGPPHTNSKAEVTV
ncbi:protein shisa-8 isoform X2 [Monodelphis domestica]|uniref:protein shisa-8 isoform X2 n=1 Tax=Monodelphis domestica TaxID=13616 RepID=UPI0024E26A64|nr:protein shisa-8 isoform X2 [Monodelphis domestica]